MGFIGLVTRAQKCEKEKKKKPFCKFQGLQNGIIFEKIAQKSQVGEPPPNFYFTVYQCSTKFTHLFHLISFDKVIKYILQPSEFRRNMMNRKERKRTCFCSEKTKMGNRASGLCGVGKCAENIPQMAKWLYRLVSE